MAFIPTPTANEASESAYKQFLSIPATRKQLGTMPIKLIGWEIARTARAERDAAVSSNGEVRRTAPKLADFQQELFEELERREAKIAAYEQEKAA